MPLDTESLKEFVELDKEEEDLTKKLKRITLRKEKLDPAIQDNFATEGIKNININGRTIYLHNAPYIKLLGTKDEAIAAVKKSELEYLIKNIEE